MGEKTVLENPYSGLEIVEGQTVMAPEDYQDPKVLYDKLIKRVRVFRVIFIGIGLGKTFINIGGFFSHFMISL